MAESDNSSCGRALFILLCSPMWMLYLSFRWKSDILSQLGQPDPCDALTTVDVDDFKLTVATKVLVPLMVVGVLVLPTSFIVWLADDGDDKCCSRVSFALLLTILVIEGILFGVIAAGISTGADYYKSAIRDTPNPTRLYNWYNGSDNCSAAMDKFQSEALCCGYRNLTEWDKTRPSNWNKDIFPPSCCTDFHLKTGSPEDRTWCTRKLITFSDVSCISRLKLWIFTQWVGILGLCTLVLGLVQLFSAAEWIYYLCKSEPAPERMRIVEREVHVPVPVPFVSPPRSVKRTQYEAIQG